MEMPKPNRGGKRGTGSIISQGEKDLNYARVGASFEKLSTELKDSINKNLKISQFMKDDIRNNKKNKVEDVWTTGFGNNKIKVITSAQKGRLSYTIKKRNKILKRDVTKEQAANAVAKFYLDAMKGG